MSYRAQNTLLTDRIALLFWKVLSNAYGVFWAGNAEGLLPGANCRTLITLRANSLFNHFPSYHLRTNIMFLVDPMLKPFF